MANFYDNNYNSGLFNNQSDIFNQRKSWKEKKRNDFKWAEDCAYYINNSYSPLADTKRRNRIQMNYDLYNGQGETAMRSFGEQTGFEELIDEGFSAGYENIQHHPIIDQIAKALVGEQQLRPFTPIAVDSSEYSLNARKLKRLQLLQERIQQTIISPLQEQIIQQYLIDNKIEDPYKLAPEQQQKMQQDIDSMVQSKSPDEIENFMRKEYKSPSETQAQKLMDFLSDYLDIKHLTDEGFKNYIISGEQVYRVGIRHNFPFIELVNPLGFYHIARPNAMFIEEGIAAKYEQYVTYNDIYNWHGDEIGRNKTLKEKLDKYSRDQSGLPSQRIVDDLTYRDPKYLQEMPGMMTREGQEAMRKLFGASNTYKQGGDIKYTHVVWKSLRKLKYITRLDPQGKKTYFWIDESYEFNPLNGDIKEEEAWIPEVWETTIVGEGIDAIYLNKQPLPFQYKSIDNPWDCKLPYVGIQYSKLMGNTTNIAPMDPGKPWQYKFNVQMAKLHEMEASDLGKVFLTSFHAKPKGWSWQKYIMMAKHGKIIPIDLQQEGVTPADAQVFKALDLSTIQDMAGKMQYLEFLRNQVALAMSYNPSRLGMQANSVSVTNNQQNIMQSSYQTYDIFNSHNKVIENLLNVLINTARVAFKENIPIKNYVLSDMSIAELDLDWEMLDRSELAIKMKNSAQDLENILEIKRLMQPMVQNGLISFPELIRMQFSKSGADLMNIAENAEDRMQKQAQQNRQQEQEQMQQQAELQQQMIKMQQDFELYKQAQEHQNNLQVAEIEAMKYANQMDMDHNQQNDNYDIAMLEMEVKMKELELKELELQLKYSLSEKELNNKLSSQDKDINTKKEENRNKIQLEHKKLTQEKELKLKEIEVKRIAANKRKISK